MATALTGRTIAGSYKDLVQVYNGNQGIDSTLRRISDGEGTDSSALISTNKFQIRPASNGTDSFEVVNSSGSVIFQIDTTNNKVVLPSGVTIEGDGSGLTGVLSAGVGGASSTGNLEVLADSDSSGSGDIIFKIGTKVVARIPYSYASGLAVGEEGTYFATTDFLKNVLNVRYEDIGVPGTLGFGVGICTNLPTGFSALPGTFTKTSDEYGNYVHDATGSIMVYIPKHYVSISATNEFDVKSMYDFADEATANVNGYFLPRAFIDGDVEQDGYFRDKYKANGIESNVAVSKQFLKPIVSSEATTGYGFNDCTGNSQTPTNTLGGALAVAKSRGNDFYCSTIFHDFDLFCLTMAHKQALESGVTTYGAWNDVSPYFPKGNNNNALKDTNDTSVTFSTAGDADYSQRALTGSGSPFNKTTHNGQNCGIADVNGNLNTVSWGLTSDGTNLYVLKESKAFKDMIDGTSGATHAFDVANYDSIGANPSIFSQIGGTAGWTRLGSGANQVFSGETDRTQLNYKLANVGLPLPGGHDASGTVDFGNDGIYVPAAFPSALCPLSGGIWSYDAYAGVGYRFLSFSRTGSSAGVGVGACLSHVNA